jgi:hypothetical protein
MSRSDDVECGPTSQHQPSKTSSRKQPRSTIVLLSPRQKEGEEEDALSGNEHFAREIKWALSGARKQYVNYSNPLSTKGKRRSRRDLAERAGN